MAEIHRQPFLRSLFLHREWVQSFEVYPYNLPAIRNLTSLAFHPHVTFLVGENGSGKSTLLEAMAYQLELNPEGGSRNFNFATRDSLSDLQSKITLAKGIYAPGDSYFLRAESFFNVATEIERLDRENGGPALIDRYGGRSLHEQSHGESFMALFMNRFRGQGLYLLDEPEAALSPLRQMSFLTMLDELVQRGSQLIIATHSPIIMAYPKSWIYTLDTGGIERTEYTDTEHYRITKNFLNQTERMLAQLLEP